MEPNNKLTVQQALKQLSEDTSEVAIDDFDRRWEAEFGPDDVPSILPVEDAMAELRKMERFE